MPQAQAVVPDPQAGAPMSAIEEQLRQLGYGFNPGGRAVVQAGPAFQGTPDPQSAVARMLAEQNAAYQQGVAGLQPLPQEAPPPPPEPIPDPTALAPKVDGGPESDSINPLWALPALAAAAGLAKLLGARGIARKGKDVAKGAKGVEAAAAAADAARAKVKPGVGKAGAKQGPNRPLALPAPTATHVALPPPAIPAAANDVVPPPTLTQVDVPQGVEQALAQRARSNMTGGGSGRVPAPVTPRPVEPTYMEPLAEAPDIQGNELAKAIMLSGQLARDRAASAAKTVKVNKKRPGNFGEPERQQYTPDRTVPQEEGERKAWNQVTKKMQDTKNPPKEEPKDLKPWLKESKKGAGQPVMPAKPRGKRAKPQYRLKGKVPEVAEAIGERKVTALKGKRAPLSRTETGNKRPPESTHSGNQFGKFVGRSGARTAKDEPTVLRNLTTTEKASVLATAKRLVKERSEALPEKASRANRANRQRTKGKYPMAEDFKAVYGDSPTARALYDAAMGETRLKQLGIETARNVKGK